MNPQALIATLGANLAGLGPRRLSLLAATGIGIIALIAFGFHFLSRPSTVTLYTGLDRQDTSAIGDALTRDGIVFDVSADGETVLVPPSDVARARQLLAEKGLPRSTSAGYELFDRMGSLGLTSFMQDVTLARALEGEIARTIQTMRGISAARVHLVLPDKRVLARDRRPPSASVVIRTDGAPFPDSARAIRHLVAAAVPGLDTGAVTVMNTDGQVISGDSEGSLPSASTLLGLEKTVSGLVEQNIRRALTATLGAGNVQISVNAKLNTDRRRIEETVFDPEGRVERQVRVVRESGDSVNGQSDGAVTVAEDLPEDQANAASASQSRDSRERREETTSYEVSGRRIATESDGYAIEALSVAIVVNEAAFEGLDETARAARLETIRAISESAGGINAERGDRLEVAAFGFVDPLDGEAVAEGFSPMRLLEDQLGTLLRAAAMLAVALILVFGGLRPALRSVAVPPNGPTLAADGTSPALSDGRTNDGPDPAADIAGQLDDAARRRLQRIVEMDEERAVAVLRDWLRQA